MIGNAKKRPAYSNIEVVVALTMAGLVKTGPSSDQVRSQNPYLVCRAVLFVSYVSYPHHIAFVRLERLAATESQNRRNEYVNQLFRLINWDNVAIRMQAVFAARRLT